MYTDGPELFFVPLLVRPVPSALDQGEGWLDATSPYGYASPLSTCTEEGFLNAAVEALVSACSAARIVSIFIRLHPLLHLPVEVMKRFGRVVSHGSTVYIDLAKTSENLMAETMKGHRYDLKKLTRAGFAVRWNDWTLYAAFIEIYLRTMERVNAAGYYFFSDDYFLGLREALGERLSLGIALAPDGSLAAGSLFTECNGIVQYHLSATAPDFLRSAPSKLVLDSARFRAKDRRNRYMHLGGGVGGREDSLFRFKAGFSPDTSTFFSFRIVADDRVYKSLVDRSFGSAEVQEDGSDLFFPKYRSRM